MISGQLSGVSEKRPVARKCATEGCNAQVWDDDFCARCEEEIRALARMAEEAEMREARKLAALSARELERYLAQKERIEAFRRAGRFVRRWIWLPELVVVACGLAYLCAVYGAAVIEWMGGN